MKLTLKFTRNDSDLNPCACLVYREGETIALSCAVAKTWAEAEAEAIARAKAQLDAGPPPNEKEIEV